MRTCLTLASNAHFAALPLSHHAAAQATRPSTPTRYGWLRQPPDRTGFALATKAFATAGALSSHALASRSRSPYSHGMVGWSVAMDEPAVGWTRRSLRNDLQLIALVLGIAAWDASVVFTVK